MSAGAVMAEPARGEARAEAGSLWAPRADETGSPSSARKGWADNWPLAL